MARIATLKPVLRTLPTRLKPLPKVTESIYGSGAWREAKARVYATQPHICAHCQRQGVRLYVDHIRELRDGGAAFDTSNLQLLCSPCHGRKTAKARGERDRGGINL
jgi:5-methylcytosine-specific restriction endonuclease McrA